MSLVVVREADVEALTDARGYGVSLLADSSATGGALSSHRVRLAEGADGAVPHRHDRSSELFYVVSGRLQVLAGVDVTTVGAGELAVVPPELPHAFAAAPGSEAEALIVITPGVERFAYFRQLARVVTGAEPRESLLAVQERYDTWFLDSPAWRTARG